MILRPDIAVPSWYINGKILLCRVFIATMCVLSILWIPLVRSSQSGQLFLYVNVMLGYLATPIGAVFLFAVLWKRTTESVNIVAKGRNSRR